MIYLVEARKRQHSVNDGIYGIFVILLSYFPSFF